MADSADNPPVVPVAISLFFEKGHFLYRGENGHALYVYDKDSKGQSHCTGRCTMTWMPVAAPAGAEPIGDWTAIKRPDSSSDQWSYKGRPVYTNADDEPGDTTGDGADGAWHLFKP